MITYEFERHKMEVSHDMGAGETWDRNGFV